MLERLEVLAGDWETTAIVGDQELGGVTTSFEWVDDGWFMRMHADTDGEPAPPQSDFERLWIENSPFPVTVYIGGDDNTGMFTYIYADGRGVHRVYEMTLEDGAWEIHGRPREDWYQRFQGAFSDDGDTIDARWEQSKDGATWELDFELRYERRR